MQETQLIHWNKNGVFKPWWVDRSKIKERYSLFNKRRGLCPPQRKVEGLKLPSPSRFRRLWYKNIFSLKLEEKWEYSSLSLKNFSYIYIYKKRDSSSTWKGGLAVYDTSQCKHFTYVWVWNRYYIYYFPLLKKLLLHILILVGCETLRQ